MRIGLIGGHGHTTPRHFPDAELAWACDGRDEVALRKAGALGVERTYRDRAEMLADFRPELIYVGSVYSENGRIAVEMLERGLPVVAEKPLATDRETLRRLREFAADGQLRLAGEFTMRAMPAFAKAREVIRSGRIGVPIMLQAQKTYKFGPGRPDFYGRRDDFGGIIPWVAIHAIDYSMWCAGLRFESVQAVHGNRCFPEYPEMEDHAAMLFRMEGNVPCVITADFLRPQGAPAHGDDRLRVTGSRGIVEVLQRKVSVSDSETTEEWDFDGESMDGAGLARELIATAMGESGGVFSADEALHVSEAALAARESADGGGDSRGIGGRG